MPGSPYEAAALNRIAGLRATCGNYNAPCNIGAFLQDLPENNHILIVDKAGLPMPGADVLIYNATGNGSDWYGKTIDNTPDQSYTADDDGYIICPETPSTLADRSSIPTAMPTAPWCFVSRIRIMSGIVFRK